MVAYSADTSVTERERERPENGHEKFNYNFSDATNDVPFNNIYVEK